MVRYRKGIRQTMTRAVITILTLMWLLSISNLTLQAKGQPDLVIDESKVAVDGQKRFIIDEYGVYTEKEIQDLNEKFRQFAEKNDIELVVVFVRDLKKQFISTNYQKMGIQFIEKYDYGIGRKKTVALMIVDMKYRWIQLVGHGRMYDTIDNLELRKDIITDVGYLLRKDNFVGAAEKFQKMAWKGYRKISGDLWQKWHLGLLNWWAPLVGILGGFFYSIEVVNKHNKIRMSPSVCFEVGNSFRIKNSIDRFLKVETESCVVDSGSDSSGSGSGGFTSDSGGGYSGGGGSF